MFLLLVALVVVPIAELYVFVQAAHSFGFFTTLAVLLTISLLGAWLVKREGIQVWRRMQVSVRNRQLPAREAVDGFLVLLAGALLLTPGFITDAVGLLVLFPPTRYLIGTILLGRFVVSSGVVQATHSGPIDVNGTENDRTENWRKPSGELGG